MRQFRTDQDITIDESIRVISVSGKLDNVRWLETEYKATKQPVSVRRYNSYKTFQQYVLEVPAEKVFDLIRRLQATEGVWFDEQPKISY